MLKGSNSNEVVQRVKAKIPIIQKSLPDDVVIEAFIDRSNFVNRAISTVEKNLTEGALIVIFVLVLFLGNFRAGLIVASAIPLSMLFALGLMNVFGVSANLMSLGGLAIAIGMLVDGAVVVVENIETAFAAHAQKHHALSTTEILLAAVRQVVKPVVSGVLIICVVFLPLLSLRDAALLQGDRIAYVNPAGVRMMQALSANAIIGCSVHDVFHPFSLPLIESRLALLRETVHAFARGEPPASTPP